MISPLFSFVRRAEASVWVLRLAPDWRSPRRSCRGAETEEPSCLQAGERNAPSGGPTFCARQKVGKERAKGGPPSWGPSCGIHSTMTGQSQPQNDPGRQRPELTQQPNALPRFCGGKRGAADLHPPRRRNRGATTDSTEQERQRSWKQSQCKNAAPSKCCRNFRQTGKGST